MLTGLALLFLCGLLLGRLCQQLKLPGLIGMLIAGIVLGPHALNLLSPSLLAVSTDLRQLALILILARAGLSLDSEDLKQIGRPAVLMSFVPACFEMAATILLAPLLFGISLLEAALLAAVIASASPAVIVPRMLKLMDTGYGTDKRIPALILAGDSVDDIFNIVVFTALLGLADGQTVSALSFAVIPLSIVSGIGVGVLAGYVLSLLFKRIPMRGAAKVLVLLSTAFLLVALEAWVEAIFPFSGLLAVMAAGICILRAHPDSARQLSGKLSQLWVGAEIVLFTLVGASLNVSYAFSAGLKTVLLLLFVLSIRALGILLCLLKTNLNRRERLFCTFTGIPKATVQAAIGGIPLAMGLACGSLVLSVAVLTILLTAPIGAWLIDISYRRLLTRSASSDKL